MQKPPDPQTEERHYTYGGLITIGATIVMGCGFVGTGNGWFAFGFWLFLVLTVVFQVLYENARVRRIREQLNRET